MSEQPRTYTLSFEMVSAIAHPRHYRGDRPAVAASDVPDEHWHHVQRTGGYDDILGQYEGLVRLMRGGELIRDVSVVVTPRRVDAELARIAEETGEPIEIVRDMHDAMQACGDEERIEREAHRDAGLRDEILAILSPHAAGCQDTECSWCDDAAKRTDLVMEAIAEAYGATP